MVAGCKAKAGLIVALAVFLCICLCGCAQTPLLSQREVVHGVFFQTHGKTSTALLLLADQPKEQGGENSGYKTVVGTGVTPAQALEQAQSSLDGQVFYGLMDLAVLPMEGDWKSTTELGRLLYEKVQPAPQMTLIMMESIPTRELTENASELYETLEKALDKYGIRNGLQNLFCAQKECALPVWQGTEYGFAFLQQGRTSLVLEDPLSAQLAAVLCGQADRFACDFSQGTAAVQGKAMLQHRVQEKGSAELYLTLDDPEVQELGLTQRDEAQLKQVLREELGQAYGQIVSETCVPGFDPLRMQVWVWAACGATDQLPQPDLTVSFAA